MRDLSDDQWEVLDTLIPKPKRRIDCLRESLEEPPISRDIAANDVRLAS